MFTKNLSILLLCSGVALNAGAWSRFTASVVKGAGALGLLKVAEVTGENKRSTGSIFGKTQIQLDIEEAYATGEALHQADIARVAAQVKARAEYNATVATKTAVFNEAVQCEAFVPNRELTRVEKAKFWVKDSRAYQGLASILDTATEVAINQYNQPRSLEAGKERIIAGASSARAGLASAIAAMPSRKDVKTSCSAGLASVVEYGKTHTAREIAIDCGKAVQMGAPLALSTVALIALARNHQA